MKWKRYNKASAAALAGIIVGGVGIFLETDPKLLVSLETIIATFLVWLVPNRE